MVAAGGKATNSRRSPARSPLLARRDGNGSSLEMNRDVATRSLSPSRKIHVCGLASKESMVLFLGHDSIFYF